ncbi:pre-mRNA-splicing factor 38A-like isoform X2 [Corticium candelabrum]|uniref:pre-mRNA-splicing factor 38A-like isoform X2 n=1 Tax=Corticium candelabrum TaxID=121492 RepID=UPI002E25F3CD|nr:pre-mRNA-splicing factor 38A-like isoform X2 [Corticium candelabrum]
MSDAPAVEEGELPSSPLTAEDEDLEEGEILESDNEENGEKEAKKSPEPPPRVGGQKEKEKDREREETSHRNTRKGIEVWADFYPTNRSVPSPRANRHSDDSPYSDSDPEREDRSYSRSRRDRYDDESHNRSHDREKRPLLRDEKTHEYLSRMRKEASRAPKPQPRVTCKFWARGVCRKGDECEFAHEGSRHKKKELCKFYSTGVCVRGRDCLFLHDILTFTSNQ